jgi:hypothetical protein
MSFRATFPFGNFHPLGHPPEYFEVIPSTVRTLEFRPSVLLSGYELIAEESTKVPSTVRALEFRPSVLLSPERGKNCRREQAIAIRVCGNCIEVRCMFPDPDGDYRYIMHGP